jgi:hypothetical protein
MSISASSVAEVLIVYDSQAGISATLTLYRALHTCIISDPNKPRNSYGTATHLTSAWEHQNPEAFKEAARKEL